MFSAFHALNPLQPSVASGGAPPGGSPLLTDLVDWWEDGSLTGSHASAVLESNHLSSTADNEGPNGETIRYITQLGGYARQVSYMPSGDWALVKGMRLLNDVAYGVIGAGVASTNLYAVRAAYNSDFDFRIGGQTRRTYVFYSLNTWFALALSYNSSTRVFTLSHSDGGSWSYTDPDTFVPFYPYWLSAPYDQLLIAARYDRQFDADDLALFYNSGSFRTYASL